MGSSCLNKTEYDKAVASSGNVLCLVVIIEPWRVYKYNEDECSCVEKSCINVYSEEKYCKSIEESLKWCDDDKPSDYSYSPDESECLEMKIKFDENCKAENNVDETADWQTYRSEEYGFEIIFPSSWQNHLGFLREGGFDKVYILYYRSENSLAGKSLQVNNLENIKNDIEKIDKFITGGELIEETDEIYINGQLF